MNKGCREELDGKIIAKSGMHTPQGDPSPRKLEHFLAILGSVSSGLTIIEAFSTCNLDKNDPNLLRLVIELITL